MSRQPKKKRQHYVPRLILRNFSKDGHRISLLVLATGQVINNAGLREQCYENYFYGVDGEIEDAFAKSEAEFSKIIGNGDGIHLETATEEQIHSLCEFAHYQRMRTVAAAEYTNILNDTLLKAIFSNDSQLNNVNWSEFQIGQSPQHTALYSAAETIPLLRDLDAKFLVSEKKLGFIISDDPAIIYNQFAEHHPLFRNWPTSRGLAFKGLQMFLPISPRTYLAIYDPSTYEYGSPKSRVCKASMSDIRLLNTLQALHAHRCVYFDPDCIPKEELDRLRLERVRRGDWRKPRLFESPLTEREDGQMSQFIGFSSPELRLGTQFNFSKIIDRASYEGYNRVHLPVRSPELVEATEAYSQFLKEQVEAKAAEKQAGTDVGNNPGEKEESENKD
jgi:hypothetical protein